MRFATFNFRDGDYEELDRSEWGRIYKLTVPKSQILFCTDEGGEDEVVLSTAVAGKISPSGQILLALQSGPKEALDEYAKQVRLGYKDQVSEHEPYLKFWQDAAATLAARLPQGEGIK